jgi:hypothetical protein
MTSKGTAATYTGKMNDSGLGNAVNSVRWHTVRVGFFERNRDEVVRRGFDPSRLPPGQYLTDRYPVLHVGDVPEYGPGEWSLTIGGDVDKPFVVTYDELRSMPATTVTVDIHCVTINGNPRSRACRVRLHDERSAGRRHARRLPRRVRVRR